MGQWISVKIMRPENGKRVLVAYENGFVGIGEVQHGKFGCTVEISDSGEWEHIWKATHWMPLPEPPKERQK